MEDWIEKKSVRLDWIRNREFELNQQLSNDYTELTKKRLNWIKKIKSNQKLPSDYIELIKKDQTE